MSANQGRASDGWDRHADTYMRVGSPLTGYISQTLFHTAAGRLPAGARVLEVACGNGELSRAAALYLRQQQRATGRAGQVVATDFSAAMVALAQRTLAGLGEEGLVRCEVQDGQALGYAAETFDAVFSAFGIFLFPDRAAGWREAARVLRPGGLLATAVWRGPEHNELTRMQTAPLLAALPEAVRASLPRPGWLEIATAEGLVQEVCAAGFVEPEVTVFDAWLTVPTPATLWDMMQENPFTKPLLAACSAAELAAVERAMLDALEARAGGAQLPLQLGASCHLLIARRG